MPCRITLLAALTALPGLAQQPLVGRYVRVEAAADHTSELHFAELEAYVGGRNVALKRPVAVSSTLGRFAGGLAVDGVVEYEWGPTASFWSAAAGGAQWWEVDLGTALPLERLVLYNRLDCCQERLTGAVLRVLTADRREVYRQVLEAASPFEQVWVEPLVPPVDFAAQTLAQRRQEVSPVFSRPASDPAEVMPVGAGDLSAMVSYTDRLVLHLSKCDVFGVQQPVYHYSPTGLSPGHVELDLGLPAATLTSFEQRLELDRGTVTLALGTAAGIVRLTVVGLLGDNALLVQVDDPRPAPQLTTHTTSHRASVEARQVADWQLLREVHSYTESGQPPADPAKVSPGDRFFRFGWATLVGRREAPVVAGQPRRSWVLVTCRTTRDGQPEAAALTAATALRDSDLAARVARQAAWWQQFWEAAWVDLRGGDGDRLTRLWHTGYLSYAGVATHATTPPKFNGGPGLIRGDERSWGWGYWWQNTRELIWPLLAGNRLALARDYLDFYDAQFSDWQRSTAHGGKLGIRMWEAATPPRPTPPPARQPSPFDPAAIPRAMADLRMEQCKSGYNARSLCQSTELAKLFCDYAAAAGDAAYERRVAAAWVREAALFWLSWLRPGDDGRYHSMVTDSAEMWWKIKDSAPDLAAARWCFDRVVRDGVRWGYEPGLIDLARERLAKLAPLPVGRITRQGSQVTGFDRTVDQLAPLGEFYDDREAHNMENPELYAVYPFELIDAGSPPAELARAVLAFRNRAHPNAGGWSQCPIQAARLHLPTTAAVIDEHLRRHQKYPYGGWNSPGNKLAGSTHGVTDVPYFDSVGVNLTALQECLLQSHRGVLELLPAASPKWAGRFRLRAGAVLVDCEFQAKQRITLVTLTALRPTTATLRNPWERCRVQAGDAAPVESGERQVSVTLTASQVARFSPAG
ncbi:MAG: discoidin domain-containing protein [Fimbriimonadaceae bacterium]|nr:discoidin domain-containing protein [Fimbriimonadaceae bacterium]